MQNAEPEMHESSVFDIVYPPNFPLRGPLHSCDLGLRDLPTLQHAMWRLLGMTKIDNACISGLYFRVPPEEQRRPVGEGEH
ncbi:MAG: hypothetical protein IJ131_09925, partial [Eggerthellaceae bacterium]|nr:hypothetical protein [Eggerthellaceae bacterium]